MLTLEQILKKLELMNLKKVAEASGVKHTTLWRLVKEPSDRVEYGTVKKLSDYFEGKE